MAKEKKNRRKGIVDPRKAERAQRRAAASRGKAESDADLATKVYKANKIAKAVESAKPEVETTGTAFTPPTSVPERDADVKLGYADRPIARGERPVPTLDAADVADDAAQAAIIREDDRRKALQETGEAVQPRTPLDVVKGIQERRAAAEQERVAGMARVDLPSAVGEGFEDVTDAEAARRASERTARRGTGVVDYDRMATGGRAGAGLTAPQAERADRRTSDRIEKTAAKAGIDLSRRSDAEAAFGGALAPDEALRPYTDKPEVMDLARRLKTSDLMDQGKDITPEAVESGLQGGPHQRMARIIHHTGMDAENVRNLTDDQLNEFHETVMNNVRSRRKNNVLPQMGLVRGEDGSITATEAAETETWQHPTEKDANGLPKTYKVSDMHPDMIKQLNHPWGGVRSENAFEGTSVLRETPAISDAAKKNPALRYQVANAKSAGDYLPVSIRFGHDKNAAGAWSFTPPPEGFSDSSLADPEGFTSNVTHITDAMREGRYKRRPGTRSAHAEQTKKLIDQYASQGKRIGVTRQVAVPMPGFTEKGGAPATTAYKRDIDDIPKAGDDNIITYDDLPHVKDEHGNLVPLAPRSGVPGTGRSVHVVQGTMGMGQQFTSPAEESAKTLGGFEVTAATEKVRTRKKKDGSVSTTTTSVPGEVSNVAEGEIARGNRSSRTRSLLRGNTAVGKQFMGVQGLEPQYRGKQGIIPGFENYGNVERRRGISAEPILKAVEGPMTESQSLAFKETGIDPEATNRTTGLPQRVMTAKVGEKGGFPAETLNTSIADSRTLRLRAEAGVTKPDTEVSVTSNFAGPGETPKVNTTFTSTGTQTTGLEDLRRATGAASTAPAMQQDELDFNPTVPGAVKSRQFMLGKVRGLTDAERDVENVGANTIRGMNPPAKNFLVGAPTPTAARATTEPAVSSGEVELTKRGGGRRTLQSGERVEGTNVVVNATEGGAKAKKSRPLKRPPNSAALAE